MLRLSCVDPRSYARIWLEAMHEGAIMVSVHSLTQDSHNALNRSRTGGGDELVNRSYRDRAADDLGHRDVTRNLSREL